MSLSHPIKVAAMRTGLSPHVIRAWEKRYGVVEPSRSHKNRRLYSDEEIERLKLLNLATQAGHSIGNICGLSVDQLRSLIPAASINGHHASVEPPKAAQPDVILQKAMDSIAQFDESGLDDCLNQSAMRLGIQGMLHQFVVPLTQRIGTAWEEGRISVAHEHFASAKIRSFLCESIRPYAADASAPTLVSATPSSQLHELGAVIVTVAAANRGWRVVYLGCSLPAMEIAGAVLQNRASALALSLVYPEDDPKLAQELLAIRRHIGPDVAILAGGRAAPAYREPLSQIQARVAGSLGDFCSQLDAVRSDIRKRGDVTPS